MRLLLESAVLAVASLLLTILVEGARIEGQVLGVAFRGKIVRGVSAKTTVILSGGRFQTQVQNDGTFSFNEVPVGTYLLQVRSPYLTYPKVRIAITAKEMQATQISLGDHFSGYQKALQLPLILRPRARPIHYIPPEGAKVAGWFANPMLLMSSFSLLMLLMMPKIMASLDEETLHALRTSYDFGCIPSLPSLSTTHPLGPMFDQTMSVPLRHTLPHQQLSTMDIMMSKPSCPQAQQGDHEQIKKYK